MNARFARVAIPYLTLLIMTHAGAQEMSPPKPTEQHAWLQQLVGDWTIKSTATMSPGSEPMTMEGEDSVRPFGDIWVLSDGKGDVPGGHFRSRMTLGFDPEKKTFVGTWIDTLQTHLWVYQGTLDEAKKILTLATEGPSMSDPKKMAKYRDVIEIVDRDHRTLTSSALMEDGKWMQFMRAEFTRKK